MLRYLVDPIFQVINTAGKPATGGYIEVYLHGTRDKYYCSSDFNGTLHPFKIPLDSLGANIILADDANAYDIYVYNRYGSLLMSRYNVAPVHGSGGCLTPSDIVPLILKRGAHTVGSYSPLEQKAKTIDIGDSIVYVTEHTENLHAAITGYLAREITPVLVKSDTDPDTPGVTRDFYFYPTARTGVDSDYSFIGYDGEVVKVATVHDDDTVTYTTYGEQIPFEYTADVMYSPNVKVNSLGQTVLVQKGRPNRLIARYDGERVPGYIVDATDISNGYIEIEIPLPSFTLNGVTVTPNFLFAYNYKYLTSIEGLSTDENGRAAYKKIEVILRMESDHTQDYIIAVATDFSKDEYGRNLSDVAGLERQQQSRYRRTYPKDCIQNFGLRFTKILVRLHFDLEFNEGIMANLQPGDSVGYPPEVRIVMDPLFNTSYQQEIGNV